MNLLLTATLVASLAATPPKSHLPNCTAGIIPLPEQTIGVNAPTRILTLACANPIRVIPHVTFKPIKAAAGSTWSMSGMLYSCTSSPCNLAGNATASIVYIGTDQGVAATPDALSLLPESTPQLRDLMLEINSSTVAAPGAPIAVSDVKISADSYIEIKLQEQDTSITERGTCVARSGMDESSAEEACLNRLIPKQPRPVIQTPATFFVGYAWGSTSNRWVYGPQIGITGAVEFPIVRPALERKSGDGSYEYALPDSMSFTFDVVTSLGVNLSAFSFPQAPAGSQRTPGNAELGFNAGAFVAPEIGGVWYDSNRQSHKVALQLGLLGGYISTQATGDGFLLGLQPALVTSF